MVFGFGKKNKKKDVDDDEDEDELDLVMFQGALNEVQPDLAANAKLAQAGLVPSKSIVTDAIARRAEWVRIEPRGQAAVVSLSIDGVKYPGRKLPQNQGLAVGQMLKLLAGLDIKLRTKPQAGGIKATHNDIPYELDVKSLPIPTGGERVQVNVRNMKQKLDTPDAMGIPQEIRTKVRELLESKTGCVFVCGPRESGTTALVEGVVLSVDSYIYSVYTLADPSGRELRNVPKFQGEPGDDFETTVGRCVRSEADCIYVNPVRDAEYAQLLFQLQEKVAIISEFTAKDAPHGLAQVVEWVGDPQVVAQGLRGIFSPRLIRLLCTKCRHAFRPNPKLLEKVGLPPETKMLYRPPKKGDDEESDFEICRVCSGIGYLGRTVLIEFIEMNEKMQELVVRGASVAEIKAAAKEQKFPTFQRRGLELVAAGKTSLEELQRVLQG